MKAPNVTSSRPLRGGLAVVVAVAVALCAVTLSACGGSSATTNAGVLSKGWRQGAEHVHSEERLRRLEARLHQVKHQSGRSRVIPVPYVPSTEPSTGDGTYYAPEPTTSGSCGGELSVNSNTTCPFAQNVEQAYYEEVGSGPGVVVAYSPAMERDYTMTCSGSPHECTGGDDAAVYFP